MSDLISSILELSSSDADVQKALELILSHFNSETGTIHTLDESTQLLHLRSYKGLPPHIAELAKVIPVGKGIAGETAKIREPVTICNLQTDKSGVAKPAAKDTGVGGSLCVPIFNGDILVGTLGVGTRREYSYTPEETELLLSVGRILGERLSA